jgi:hypothetical protein
MECVNNETSLRLDFPMTMMIELRPEVEAGLASIAAEQGISLAHYVRRVLEEQLPARPQTILTPTERPQAWRDSVKIFPIRSPCPMKRSAVRASTIHADECAGGHQRITPAHPNKSSQPCRRA